jgi:hypothetical protein
MLPSEQPAASPSRPDDRVDAAADSPTSEHSFPFLTFKASILDVFREVLQDRFLIYVVGFLSGVFFAIYLIEREFS